MMRIIEEPTDYSFSFYVNPQRDRARFDSYDKGGNSYDLVNETKSRVAFNKLTL